MNSRLLSITAIIIAVGFVSNVLLVNPAFAGDSEARKAAKAKEKTLTDQIKKDKNKASLTKQINTLQNKLAGLQAELQKNPSNSALQAKITDVQNKITKLQQRLSKV